MEYQQCVRCIMDNSSDATIFFDANGYCNYCTQSIKNIKRRYFPNEIGQKKLQSLINKLKSRNSEYDCIMGISGGLDSSYLAYLGSVKWGLRILAVHVDDGFDTEITKRNISRISNFPNFDLRIIKPDSYQFTELIKAFMRAGVPNIFIPQDNVLFANVYNFLKNNHLKTFLSGSNFALECILQKGNTHDPYDLKNIKYIHKKFGKGNIDKLTLLSGLKKDINRFLLNVETTEPLNFIDYNRDRAITELTNYCNFEYYGGKHLENELTKFIQQYWLYKKFNVDKRKSHLSSMIVSGQITREEAVRQCSLPIYDEKDMEDTISTIIKKLNMNKNEFDMIMQSQTHQHWDYPISNYRKLKSILKAIYSYPLTNRKNRN